MRYRPRVLLVHPDTDLVQRCRAALPSCEVAVVTDSSTAVAVATEHESEVVLGACNEQLMDALLAHRTGLRFIYFGGPLSAELIETTARGYDVQYVDGIGDLEARVFALARRTRAASRHALDGLTLSCEVGDFEVVDVSRHGMSFRASSADDLDGFQPGAMLYGVVITRRSRPVIGAVDLCVRRIDVRDSGYVVGCEFRAAPAAPLGGRVHSDRAVCAGLLHNALRAGALQILAADVGEVVACHGSVDPTRGELLIAAAVHRFRKFDVVDGQFEMSQTSYRFRAAVTQEAPLRLKMPSTIEESRRRAAPRTRPRATTELRVCTPLSNETLRCSLFDVGPTGLSFEVPTDALLCVGLELALEFELAGESFRVQGHVRNLVRFGEGERCGVGLAIDAATRTRLADAIVRDRLPGLEDGRALGFDALWGLFRETGFLYPSKEAVLEPVMDEVRRGYEALRTSESELHRAVVIREAGRIVGHVSGLRAYRRTWMFHHLAAVQGKQAGEQVTVGAIEHLLHAPDHEYFRSWFFARVGFPSRIFGGFARRVVDPELSDIRRYAHFLVETDRRFGPAAGIHVSEANAADLVCVEQHFIATERPLMVRAEDLTKRGLELDDIKVAFARFGVMRSRRVLVAHADDGRLVGFALAELSSSGLNLSEALSSFRLFVLPHVDAPAHDVRRALLDAVLALYRNTGRRFARGLLNPIETREYDALGIQLDEAQSMCWTCHRSQLSPLIDHVRRIFERLQTRRRRTSRVPDAA